MLLSERVRPDCEVAPWVIPEIKQLETEVERLRAILSALREPSVVVQTVAYEAWNVAATAGWYHAITAAVAAAEKEVGDA